MYRYLSRPNFHSRRVRLKGLAPEKQYRIEETGEIFGGDVLMQAGTASDTSVGRLPQ